jgi:hypothetical protein
MRKFGRTLSFACDANLIGHVDVSHSQERHFAPVNFDLFPAQVTRVSKIATPICVRIGRAPGTFESRHRKPFPFKREPKRLRLPGSPAGRFPERALRADVVNTATASEELSMRHSIMAIVAFGALALAAPASAQLVNGLPGPNYNHDAPIGTKGGGSPSSLQAPGERAAITGALRNEMDARAMQRTYGPLTVKTASVKTASVKTPSLRQQTVARNEFSGARERLENSSD